jgi:hypothetical protein
VCRWRPAETGPEEAASAADALAVLRRWAPRLAASLLAAIALGAGMAVFPPPDNALFLAVNGLGDGPDWLYPALAAYLAGAAIEVVKLYVDRARWPV